MKDIIYRHYLFVKEIFEKLENADKHEIVVKCISHGSKEVAQICENGDFLSVTFHDDTVIIGATSRFQFQINREKKAGKPKALIISQ